MNQQKQQKNTRTHNPPTKDQAKIGFLAAKSTLPPLDTRSSSRTKIRQSLDSLSPQKKRKISDIFYEEIPLKKTQDSKMNSIIIQKDSILQHSSRIQQDKEQTVIKMHQKRKPHQNLLELCQFHQNKLKNQTQNEQKSQIISSRMRAHLCCETQPSLEKHFQKDSRLSILFQRNLSSKEKLKNSILKTPQKLKPLRFNRIEKTDLIDSRMSRVSSSADKNLKFKIFLSPIEAKVISDKLSKPKCTSNCGKKNCHCFDESELKKIRPFNRRNNHMMSEKQIAIKKINANINRLKNIDNQENAEAEDHSNINNLRKRINEKKTFRKNIKLKKIKQFETQGLENEKFFHQTIINENKSDRKDLSQSKISSQSDSLFKATLSPVKNILIKSYLPQNEGKKNQELNKGGNDKKYHTIEKQHGQESRYRKNTHPDTIQINHQNQSKINTFQNNNQAKQEVIKEDSFQESESIPLGIRNFIKVPKKQESIQINKKSDSSANQQQSVRKFTFGKSKSTQNSQHNQLNEQINDEKKKKKKTKDEKILLLKQKIQYWITYDIQKKIFVDVDEKKINKNQQQPKIYLVSAVVKQTIEIHNQKPSKAFQIDKQKSSKRIQIHKQQPSKETQIHSPQPSNHKQQSQKTAQIHNNQSQQSTQIHKQQPLKQIRESQSTNTQGNSEITVTPIKEQTSQVPVTLQSISPISPKKSQKQHESRILSKSRKCESSRSNKHSINMFNRNPKSLTSTRSKQYFRVPIAQECVQFVKNYKPENPQVIMQELVQRQTFKVLPMNRRVYFGQVIERNVKHGFGVEISPNQIFEGRYENGNRKQGFLKQLDGVYEGSFQNNLRHGFGIFRWNDGQIFKGEWRMGTKNGYGVWRGTDGSYYEGDWHLSMQHGKGKFVHFTSTYEGEFKNFHKQGLGKEIFPNGDIFTGEYKNGKPNGQGKYEWKDGTYYEGNFIEGLRDGYGKWHENSASFYQGQFKQDNKHGKGVQYFKDGNFLQGQFFKGQILKGILYNSKRQVIQQFDEQLQQIGES